MSVAVILTIFDHFLLNSLALEKKKKQFRDRKRKIMNKACCSLTFHLDLPSMLTAYEPVLSFPTR